MAVYTQVPAEALAALLARYDVGTLVSAKGIAEGVENSNYLLETTASRFILTLYEKRVDPADLPFFLALLDHLATAGLPVPPAVADGDGRAVQQVEGKPACLIRFLPGVSLLHPTPAQAFAAGAAMARMHEAVRDFRPTRANSMGQPTWGSLIERCGRSLDAIAPGLFDDVREVSEVVNADWQSPGVAALDRCAIHADLFPDNVLMLGDEVTGLIDFYFACTDIRLYDLAVMHAAWSFDASGRGFDAAIGDAVLAGYASRLPLTEAERALLPALATGACLRFTLSRAWDWLNTPADALVTRKDPLAFFRRIRAYKPDLAARLGTVA